MRNPVRDDVRIMIRRTKNERYEVYVSLRFTIVRTLYYFTAESFELLYILSCPIATTCEKRVLFLNFKKNNHCNLIKKYKLLHFCNVKFYNAFYRIQILNKILKLEKLVRNVCMQLRTSIYEWENLIAIDVKLSKQDFDFYCHLLHKSGVDNSKFKNYTTNISCSILNSHLLNSTVLKFSFIFIKFRVDAKNIAA